MASRPLRYTIRDISIRQSQRIRHALGRNLTGKRIVTFHDAYDAPSFRGMVAWLLEHFEVVPLEELLLGADVGKTQIALTFDDGYSTWHEFVAPTLEAFEVPAVFFVCSGYVGLRGEEAKNFRRHRIRRQQELDPLTKVQFLDIASHSLFEIGSHTVNHTDLGQPLDESVLSAELGVDKRQLEDWTGAPVRWFAYPFGSPRNISLQAEESIRREGFLAAFSLIPGYWKSSGNRYRVGRDGIDVNDSPWLWRAWLDGSYDRLYGIKAKTLGIKRKLVGSARSVEAGA